ncbi:MAG: hypothetical protein GX443_08175 [Deltaproteobacteria bacterium]|nr:hypothetical protein [Deltaproteobacteria bacterium]
MDSDPLGLPMRKLEYSQKLDSLDPFLFWTSDGSYTVNHKGISSDSLTPGGRSFELDVTFGNATYAYWMIPLRVPNIGQLRITADIRVEKTAGCSAALGTNVSLWPAPVSGINVLKRIDHPSRRWTSTVGDLVAAGKKISDQLNSQYLGGASTANHGNWTDRIGLFVFAPRGGRIVVRVKNVRVHGVVPEESAYESYAKTVWQSYLERVSAEVQTKTKAILDYTPTMTARPDDEEFIRRAKSAANDLWSTFQNRGYPTPQEYAEITSLFRQFSLSTQYVSLLTINPDTALVLFPVDPIASTSHGERISPSEDISSRLQTGQTINLKACKGEYEPASFVIRAIRRVKNIRVYSTPIHGKGQYRIPEDAVDIKLLKCWYQAGDGTIHKTDERILLPELLIYDAELVKTDHKQKRNFLRVSHESQNRYIDISSPDSMIPKAARIQDAESLLPFHMDAGTNQQVWVTLQVPEDAPPDEYSGSIIISADDISPLTLELKVTVLPFQLEKPSLLYSLYYRGQLASRREEGLHSEWKSGKQYLAELLNMKQHGVTYPTLYQKMDEDLELALALRRDAVLPTDQLFILGTNTGGTSDPAGLERLEREVRQWMSIVSRYGYGNVYIYGIDEAKGDLLKTQRTAWQSVRKGGAGVFAACYAGAADIVGDLLSVAVFSGPPRHEEIEKWHRHGKKVYSYGNPQVGIEDAAIYRKNYGYGLYCADYDGAMNYAYQHGFGHIWNDFDHPTYRDHVFAYPTSNGVIDTVQWEGYREAIDDVRYLTTLVSKGRLDEKVLKSWLCPMVRKESNMGNVRDEVVKRILSPEKPLSPARIHLLGNDQD